MEFIGFLCFAALFYWLCKPLTHSYPHAAAFDKKQIRSTISGSRLLLGLAAVCGVAVSLFVLLALAALVKHHLFGF